MGRSAPAGAVSDAEQRRLVARAVERHGVLGGLRQLARPRPELPAARQPAHSRAASSNPRRLAAIIPTLNPNTNGNRPTVSRGESEYNALIFSVRKRLSHGVDFSVNYTLQKGISTIGSAADELNTANIQDPNNPFDDPRQLGPNLTTDARHLFNLSATFQLPFGIRIAPIFAFRSALPVNLIDGRDLNLDGDAVDIPTKAYAVDSFDASDSRRVQQTTFKEIGNCETVNCGRGYYQTQTNVRLSKVFNLGGRARVEAIGEIFNLFNAINPSGFRARVNIPATRRRGSERCSNRQPTPATSVVRNSASASSAFGLRSKGARSFGPRRPGQAG